MISQMLGLDRRMGMAVNQLALLSQLTRAGLDTLTDTAGQELVFTEEGAFIELLRNRAMVMQLGATVLSGLVGNVAFPKQIGPEHSAGQVKIRVLMSANQTARLTG